MKRNVRVFFIIALLGLSYNLLAQKAKKATSLKQAPNEVFVYLGNSNLSGGKISKRTFDSLLKQGLTAKDSIGNLFMVDGFTFGYGEKNLYEDSIGNLMVLTDYYTEYCPGDTITPAIANNIFYKTKPGDTAYFDNIKVAVPGKQMPAKSMVFVLTP